MNATSFSKAFTEMKCSVRFPRHRFFLYKIFGRCHLIILLTKSLADKSHVLVVISHALLKKASKNLFFFFFQVLVPVFSVPLRIALLFNLWFYGDRFRFNL